MENPRNEISGVLTKLCTAQSSPELEDTINKYYTPDARIMHPLCQAASRQGIVGIFEMYRMMSPNTTVKELTTMYDTDLNVLVLEVEHNFKIWFSPFPVKPARLNVRITLKKSDGRHYISQQEDLFHWMDLASMFAPPLVPVVNVLLTFSGWMMGVVAMIFTFFRLTGGKYTGSRASHQFDRLLGGADSSESDQLKKNKSASRDKASSPGGHDAPQPDTEMHEKHEKHEQREQREKREK